MFQNIRQFGIEIHLNSDELKNQIKYMFSKLRENLMKLLNDYGFHLVDSAPNKCVAKREDGHKIFYTSNDILFVKKQVLTMKILLKL